MNFYVIKRVELSIKLRFLIDTKSQRKMQEIAKVTTFLRVYLQF